MPGIILGLYLGYNKGVMEKKMETTINGLGLMLLQRKDPQAQSFCIP